MVDKDASLDAINFSTKYYEIGRYFIAPMPKQKFNTVDIPGRSGYTILTKKFLPRDILVLGIIKATSKAQLITRIDTFTDFLYHDDPVKLIFNDRSDRYYLVEYQSQEELQKRGQFVPLKLRFIANDPFSYAITPDTDTQAGVTTDDTTFVIANSGHYYAYPTFTITFNQATEHIYLQNNGISGNRFDISKSFASADELIINGKTGVITLNGSDSPAGFGDGGDGSHEWVMLATGNNELQIGTSDISIDVDIATSFEKVYLS